MIRSGDSPLPANSPSSPVRRASSTLTRVVIAGAGLAGASVGYSLARTGRFAVTVLEKEELAGLHSSGRNAAMVRQITPDPAVAELARRGARGLRALAPEIEQRESSSGFYDRRGSLLLASGGSTEALYREVEEAREAGVEVEWLERAEVTRRYPVLETAVFDRAAHCPDDGVVDVAALLRHYLRGIRENGGQVLHGRPITALRQHAGHIESVFAAGEWHDCDVLVNAAGGWAPELEQLAGLDPLPLRPTRRHLFVSPPRDDIPARLPFVWDTTRQIYFRPESGGILISACDISEAGDDLDTDRIHPEVFDLLKEKIDARFPQLGELQIKKGWSGVRTLTDDGRFVIGYDPRLEGFFWTAALGGHGVTTSPAIGELAARLIEGESDPLGPLHSPARFLDAGGQRLSPVASALPRSAI